MAGIGLPHWSLQRSKMDAVVFCAGDEHDSFQMRCSASYGGDRVHQHVAIRARIGREVRCASRRSLKGGVEDVGNVSQLGELASRVFCIKEFNRDVPVACPVRRLASRQPYDLPIRLLDELLGDVAPNDTKRTDTDRLVLPTCLPGRMGSKS